MGPSGGKASEECLEEVWPSPLAKETSEFTGHESVAGQGPVLNADSIRDQPVEGAFCPEDPHEKPWASSPVGSERWPRGFSLGVGQGVWRGGVWFSSAPPSLGRGTPFIPRSSTHSSLSFPAEPWGSRAAVAPPDRRGAHFGVPPSQSAAGGPF